MLEFSADIEYKVGYDESGHCLGTVNDDLPKPQRLTWELNEEVSVQRSGNYKHTPYAVCTKVYTYYRYTLTLTGIYSTHRMEAYIRTCMHPYTLVHVYTHTKVCWYIQCKIGITVLIYSMNGIS